MNMLSKLIFKLYTLLTLKVTSAIHLNYKYNSELYLLSNTVIIGILYFSSLSFFWFKFYLLVNIIYTIIYIWRNVPFTLKSFIAFIINSWFFSLFLFGFYRIYIGIPDTIYIENLSLYSYYRYMIFLSIAILGLIIYHLVNANRMPNSLLFIANYISFPNLKEEVRLVLYTWNETIFGHLFSYIMDKCHSSKKFRYIFIVCHFGSIYLIRFVQVSLFLNFVLFHGDLRYCIYLLPFSFLSWILSFFEYYFKTFFEGTCTYIREILSVSLKEPLPRDVESKILFRNKHELNYIITASGTEKGFREDDQDNLIHEWLRCGTLYVWYEKYSSWLSYYTYFIFFVRLLLWSETTHKFLTAGWFDLLKGGSKLIPKPPQVVRPYATEAFKVKPKHYKDLETETKNAYKAGHPVMSDMAKKTGKSEIPFQGQPTHGSGSLQNPSKPLHPTEDLQGVSRAQNATFPVGDVPYFPADWVEPKPIPKSKDYFEKPEVKNNMAKHSPKSKEEN
jgi:hypothetical protein